MPCHDLAEGRASTDSKTKPGAVLLQETMTVWLEDWLMDKTADVLLWAGAGHCMAQITRNRPNRLPMVFRGAVETRSLNAGLLDRKSTRLNSSHLGISYA